MNISNKNEEISKYHKAQRLALYWLLGLIYSGFIGMQLGRIQAIADFDYGLHEIMYLPYTIAIVFVPIVYLFYLYYVIKYLSVRGKQRIQLKTVIQAVVVIASIIFIVTISNHQSQEVSTYGVFEVKKKLQEDGNFYVILEDLKKVEVSHNEFQLVIENHPYIMNYIWNKRTPNIGQLETIEPYK